MQSSGISLTGSNHPPCKHVIENAGNPGVRPEMPSEMAEGAEGDFRLLIYKIIVQRFTIKIPTMSKCECYILNANIIDIQTIFPSHKYTITQNELISSSRWPADGVGSNLHSICIFYTRRLQINAG